MVVLKNFLPQVAWISNIFFLLEIIDSFIFFLKGLVKRNGTVNDFQESLRRYKQPEAYLRLCMPLDAICVNKCMILFDRKM